MTDHNHLTRDIKAPGQCPSCDLYWHKNHTSPEIPPDTLHDEGRALVEDILWRKRIRNEREHLHQLLVYGDVHTDGHGNAIPRELPGHWKSLQAAALAGGGVEYTRGKIMTHETGWRVGGRSPARVSAQIEGTRTAVAWMDEFVQHLGKALARDPHQGVRDVVTRHELTPAAPAVPAVGSVVWRCWAPTGPALVRRNFTGRQEQMARHYLAGELRMDDLAARFNEPSLGQKFREAQLAQARELGLT